MDTKALKQQIESKIKNYEHQMMALQNEIDGNKFILETLDNNDQLTAQVETLKSGKT